MQMYIALMMARVIANMYPILTPMHDATVHCEVVHGVFVSAFVSTQHSRNDVRASGTGKGVLLGAVPGRAQKKVGPSKPNPGEGDVWGGRPFPTLTLRTIILNPDLQPLTVGLNHDRKPPIQPTDPESQADEGHKENHTFLGPRT
eukprot:2537381-Rhodomonas_salina.1